MCGYTNDFMMAVVVSSTAFIALTPVLVGQVTKSGLKQCCKKASYFLLGVSVLFGLLAILSAAAWLLPQATVPVGLVLWFFGAEVIIWEVLLLTTCFVLGLSGKLEPSKSATPPTHPQKRSPAR